MEGDRRFANLNYLREYLCEYVCEYLREYPSVYVYEYLSVYLCDFSPLRSVINVGALTLAR